MEPTPEPVEAVEEYGSFTVDLDLLDAPRTAASECGVSCRTVLVSAWRFHEHGVTLTLVASSEEIAALDGLQYLRGGPCVEAVASEKVWAYVNNADPLDEDRCRLFVRGTAAGIDCQHAQHPDCG